MVCTSGSLLNSPKCVQSKVKDTQTQQRARKLMVPGESLASSIVTFGCVNNARQSLADYSIIQQGSGSQDIRS